MPPPRRLIQKLGRMTVASAVQTKSEGQIVESAHNFPEDFPAIRIHLYLIVEYSITPLLSFFVHDYICGLFN